MEFIELVAHHNPELAEALFSLYQEIQWTMNENRGSLR